MKTFNISPLTQKKLQRGISNFLNTVVKLQPTESCLILSSDTESLSFIVASELFSYAKHITPHVSIVITTPRDLHDPMEPVVSQAMQSGFDVIIKTNAKDIGTDEKGPYEFNGEKFSSPIYLLKAKKEIRAFWFYVDNLDSFADCFTVNFKELQKLSTALGQKLLHTTKLQITSDNDTNFSLLLQKPPRKIHADYDGTQHLPGGGANLPLGEVFITPDMSSAEGTFVIDGSFNTVFPWVTIIPKKPITLEFRKGVLVNVTGGKEAELIRQNIKEALKQTKQLEKDKKISAELANHYIQTTRRVGEFAIGVNRNAKIVGNLLIDEKRYADAHIAIGSSYDGDLCLIHMDCITKHPRIVFIYDNGEKELITENGEFFFKKIL